MEEENKEEKQREEEKEEDDYLTNLSVSVYVCYIVIPFYVLLIMATYKF